MEVVSDKLKTKEERIKEKIIEMRKQARQMLLDVDQLNIYKERENENKDGEEEASFFGIEDEFIQYLKLKIQENRKKKNRGILISFHKFNEDFRIERLLRIMNYGVNVTLLSDAGTPCISDPGFKLVRRCYEEGLEVLGYAGTSACTLAACQSGFPADSFYFGGFLNKNQGEREKKLEECRELHCTAVFYENITRLGKSLLSVEKVYGSKQLIWIGNELTKLHEKKRRGTVRQLYEQISEEERERNFWKGELILVISPLGREFNADIIDTAGGDSRSEASGNRSNSHHYGEWEQTNAETEIPGSDQIKHIFNVHAKTIATILNERLDISDKDLASLIQDILKISKTRAHQLV